MKWVPVILAGFWTSASAAHGADPVDYLRDVKPILAQHCYSCHGPQKQKSGLRLDTSAAVHKGGNSGPAIVAGKSDESLLIKAVTGSDESLPSMPFQKPALSSSEIALLKTWIDQGAKAPDSERVENPKTKKTKHWAFQPITRPAEPAVYNLAWVRSPIDRFILAFRHAPGCLRASGRPSPAITTLWGALGPALAGFGPLRRFQWFQYRRATLDVEIPRLGDRRLQFGLAV